METLAESSTRVSLDEIDITSKPLKKLGQSPSQSFASYSGKTPNSTPPGKGLGISVARRPSETMLKTINSRSQNTAKVTILERPVSNDSIGSSSVSDFSEDINSRNSSLTSGSMSESPIVHQTITEDDTITNCSTPISDRRSKTKAQFNLHRLRQSASTPRLRTLSTLNNSTMSLKGSLATSPKFASSINITTSNMSSSTINTLTPSQKYRLRRQNSKSSLTATIRQREKTFDEMNSDDEGLDDGLIWNVPYTGSAAAIFSPSSGKSSKLIKNVLENSPVAMPLSPLPGYVSAPSTPLSKKSSFYSLPDEGSSISRFYQASGENYVSKELAERQEKSIRLPRNVKEASDLGLDSLKFISKEKANTISSTRPIWLPPKSPEESKKHEHDITKMIEHVAKVDKKRAESRKEMRERHEKWSKDYDELSNRGFIRNSSLYTLKRLVFKMEIPEKYRKEVWSGVLGNMGNINVEKYDKLNVKFNDISPFPKTKEIEIKQLVENSIPKLGTFQKGQPLNESLTKLMKLKTISSTGLEFGDEVLFAILLLNFDEEESYNFANLIRLNILNEDNLNKFNNNCFKNHTLKKYLNNDDFKNDYAAINSNLIFIIFRNLKSNIWLHLLDIMILNNDYKVLYAMFLTILRFYHFGFNNLKDLSSKKYEFFEIGIQDNDQFFDKMYQSYKKF